MNPVERDPEPIPDEVDAGLAYVFGNEVEGDSPSVLARIAARAGGDVRIALRDEKLADEDPMLRPLSAGDPHHTGKYVIQGELGRGGIGAVHRGHDQELGRDVALKFLQRQATSDDPEVLRRFVEEAQIGGQLQHPGIVPVYDLGMVKGQPFFAMKLVKGETLAKRLVASLAPSSSDRHSFLSIFERRLPDDGLRARARRRAPRPQARQRDDRRLRRGAGRRLGRRQGPAPRRRRRRAPERARLERWRV